MVHLESSSFSTQEIATGLGGEKGDLLLLFFIM